MSHFLDRLSYFSQPKEPFSGDHGVINGEDRTWEDAYRDRWAHDKIVRSTHGVNCTSRLRTRRQLQLVPVQREPRQIPADPRPPAQAVARSPSVA